MTRESESRLTGIVEATNAYEHWLAANTAVQSEELRAKHNAMRSNVFVFLRATFYRWAQLFPAVCPELADAPRALAVGDLHIENYGLWRDTEARLIWGINDFDEAAELPYTNDLVRLACSASLATGSITVHDACAAVLRGYRNSLNVQGQPFVLAESHPFLASLAQHQTTDARRYWRGLMKLPPLTHFPSDGEETAKTALPAGTEAVELRHRVAGKGSLGRPRGTVTGLWEGALVAREVKALVPSTWNWANDGPSTIEYQRLLDSACRAQDPFLQTHGSWAVRRLAPDNHRLDLPRHASGKDWVRLLRSMAADAANVHRGSSTADDIRRHATQLRGSTLAAAVTTMTRHVRRDFAAYSRANT